MLAVNNVLQRLKDGEPLKDDDRTKITISPDGSVRLTVDNVRPSDCGAYKLLALNDNGESSSICAVAVSRKFLICFLQNFILVRTQILLLCIFMDR